MQECEYCNEAKERTICPIFDLKCEGCRLRYLLSEPCKILRQYMAEDMARRFDVPNWKITPNCGCKATCQRHTKNQENRYKVVGF